jgi:hypothetical protein
MVWTPRDWGILGGWGLGGWGGFGTLCLGSRVSRQAHSRLPSTATYTRARARARAHHPHASANGATPHASPPAARTHPRYGLPPARPQIFPRPGYDELYAAISAAHKAGKNTVHRARYTVLDNPAKAVAGGWQASWGREAPRGGGAPRPRESPSVGCASSKRRMGALKAPALKGPWQEKTLRL